MSNNPSSFKKSISLREKELSPIDKIKSVKGEAHQGNYLISAKERNSESKNKTAQRGGGTCFTSSSHSNSA